MGIRIRDAIMECAQGKMMAPRKNEDKDIRTGISRQVWLQVENGSGGEEALRTHGLLRKHRCYGTWL